MTGSSIDHVTWRVCLVTELACRLSQQQLDCVDSRRCAHLHARTAAVKDCRRSHDSSPHSASKSDSALMAARTARAAVPSPSRRLQR